MYVHMSPDQMNASDHSGDESQILNINEESIFMAMEILGIPRGAAVDLLAQHDGDLQNAIWNVIQ